MNVHKVTITFSKDGKLELIDLPFHAGDTVEIIFLEQPKQQQSSPTSSPEYRLQGKQLYRYDDPFEPAVPAEDWEVLK
jgi:hypothetical protein